MELLIFATVRDGQRQAKLSAPRFDLAQEDVHLSGIKLRRVARLPGGFFAAGYEVGVGDFLATEIGFLEVALNPVRGRVGTPGFNQIFADFRVPHVTKCVLRQAAFFAPLFDLETQAFPFREMLLKNLAYSVEVAAMCSGLLNLAT